MRRNFIPRNEGFVCEICGTAVLPASGTFRNHCPQCLTSKHVDVVPGDRQSTCGGLMDTIRVEGTDPDTLDLMQLCRVCDTLQRNRVASDDSKEALLAVNKGLAKTL